MMKKTILFPLLAFALVTTARTYVMPNTSLGNLYDQFLIDNDSVGVIPNFKASKLVDRSFHTIYFPESEGKIVNYVNTPRKYKDFNPKKDHITDYRLVRSSVDGMHKFQLYIVHNNGNACDMNEFSVRVEGDNLVCTQSEDGNTNTYRFACTAFDFADGTYAQDGKLIVTHIASGLSVTIPYRVSWNSWVNCRGCDKAYMVVPVTSNIGKPVRALVDLSSGRLFVLTDEIGVDVSGVDGRNGYNGANGINGLDYRKWTDKEGKTHVQYATYGTRGENGGNGENGQDGGNLLLVRDDRVPKADVSVRYHGGAGGTGGRGGIGGRHGNGSGLSGRAPNGYNGADGAHGANGSAITVVLPQLAEYLSNLIATVGITTVTPYIVTDVSPKIHKGNSRKKAEKDKLDAATDAVEF